MRTQLRAPPHPQGHRGERHNEVRWTDQTLSQVGPKPATEWRVTYRKPPAASLLGARLGLARDCAGDGSPTRSSTFAPAP